MPAEKQQRLVVVSNRLPTVIARTEGGWQIEPASGGLVTAMAPVMKARDGLWLGWPGCDEEAPIRNNLV